MLGVIIIVEQIRSGKVSLGLAINGDSPNRPNFDRNVHKTTRIIERYFYKTGTKQKGYRLTPDEKVAIYLFNLEDPITSIQTPEAVRAKGKGKK